MTDVDVFVLVLVAGIFLGTFFFGGLWWTVQKGLASEHPALWFFGSTLLRTAVAIGGFYLVSAGDWRRVLVCLLGFFIARVAVTYAMRPLRKEMHAP